MHGVVRSWPSRRVLSSDCFQRRTHAPPLVGPEISGSRLHSSSGSVRVGMQVAATAALRRAPEGHLQRVQRPQRPPPTRPPPDLSEFSDSVRLTVP
jgi:hypothetical protein